MRVQYVSRLDQILTDGKMAACRKGEKIERTVFLNVRFGRLIRYGRTLRSLWNRMFFFNSSDCYHTNLTNLMTFD